MTCCIVYTYVLLHAYIISLILTTICIKLTNISIVNVWHWHGHFIRTLVCTNIGHDSTFFTITTAAYIWKFISNPANYSKSRQALYRSMLRFIRTNNSAFYVSNISQISTLAHHRVYTGTNTYVNTVLHQCLPWSQFQDVFKYYSLCNN